MRPQQRQLVGLISPGHAALHSNLRELLQTAAAGLKWDLRGTTLDSPERRSGTESMLPFNQISVIKLSPRLLLPVTDALLGISQHLFLSKWQGNVIMRGR